MSPWVGVRENVGGQLRRQCHIRQLEVVREVDTAPRGIDLLYYVGSNGYKAHFGPFGKASPHQGHGKSGRGVELLSNDNDRRGCKAKVAGM
jgi:hypothetical protein